MALLKSLVAGVRSLFQKDRMEREMDEELGEFLDAAVKEKMRRGMSRQEALRAARIELGGVEAVKEQVRAASWESRIETVWSDLRFGARLLRLNPVFAGAAILSLALGIGANTAIFQLIDAVRLRTLPVKNAQEIARVAIDHRNGASGNFSTRYPDLTYAMWEQIRAQQQGFSGLFAWGPTSFNIAPGGEVHNVEGLWASGEFFQVLGVEPALGRLFTPDDDRLGCGSPGVAISYSFWQREFGGERGVLGRTLTVNRHPFPIIGVTPADFYGVEVGRYFDVAVPLCAEPIVNGEDSQLKSRSGWWLAVMGRLKPGWSVERAAAQLRAISPGLFEATLPANFNPSLAKHFLQYKLGVFPADSGLSDLRKDYEKPLWLLLALAGLVLLIASANLANLMLARASAREKEMAMRMAVGAGRWRLIRQLLIESLLLAMIGATLGAVLGAKPKPRVDCLAEHATRSAVCRTAHGLAGAGVHDGAGGADLHPVWIGAGTARHQRSSGTSVEGERAGDDTGALAICTAADFGGVADCAVADVARGGDVVRAQPQQSSGRGCGLPANRHSGDGHRLYNAEPPERRTIGIRERYCEAGEGDTRSGCGGDCRDRPVERQRHQSGYLLGGFRRAGRRRSRRGDQSSGPGVLRDAANTDTKRSGLRRTRRGEFTQGGDCERGLCQEICKGSESGGNEISHPELKHSQYLRDRRIGERHEVRRAAGGFPANRVYGDRAIRPSGHGRADFDALERSADELDVGGEKHGERSEPEHGHFIRDVPQDD